MLIAGSIDLGALHRQIADRYNFGFVATVFFLPPAAPVHREKSDQHFRTLSLNYGLAPLISRAAWASTPRQIIADASWLFAVTALHLPAHRFGIVARG